MRQSTTLRLLPCTNHVQRVRFNASVSKQEPDDGGVVILRGPVKRRRAILGEDILRM